MDFARRVWLLLLQNPEELNSGNDAGNLRVSDVSMFFFYILLSNSSHTGEYLGKRDQLLKIVCSKLFVYICFFKKSGIGVGYLTAS